ncbi:uncharacterized protein K460DRAFT_182643 [Cucurbitaria berberidis CBS 394.84]|uniref:Uncharacterized protein n=1 Tax=Cucurbitaria berberidis CBS 394.84 TaxID=1168544 RepID=A0A9P4L580_9PLEO|nr:uncharacterized protein K460DRAFT_182643 [Cucurbitaria berberidis CBS 394.84]KAF1842345.1 hypothetical protein K460DRAFT_182643 [Cucurbitaria berberidis CBS 394.84]
MTDVMAQQGFGLNAPSSRQDVVSALLNDYGNSFGHGDTSPLEYSPVPALKELPPPPPSQGDDLRDKPLPAVQRMGMKFQLRVHEDAPLSPNGLRKDSLEQQPQRRIVSRSLSRGAKPASLKLTISNGSTATVPSTPALPALPRNFPSSGPPEEKDLPPPPPEKSIRRKSVKQATMGQDQSKSGQHLARSDSLLSQGETNATAHLSSEVVDAPPVIKRKAVPIMAVKKFMSLAELGNRPRGGKGGSIPPTSEPREAGVDNQASNLSSSDTPQASEETIKPQQQAQAQASAFNQLPPTPEEDKAALPPAPPRKVYTAVGLPSNPRAKGPASPSHIRAKSSSSFNILKAHRPAPPIPMGNVDTITPEMTPSPKLKPVETGRDVIISPVSPLPPPSEQQRPFSFEALPESQKQPAKPSPATMASPVSNPPAQDMFPPRTTSRDAPEPNLAAPPSTAPAPMTSQQPNNSSPPSLPNAEDAQSPPPPPPFTPLTRQPIPLPTSRIPQIGPAHLHCYTNHKTTVWSNNNFQPMGCMICHANERERKWACTWCQLRICRSCSEELNMIPGRNLRALLNAKGEVHGAEEGDSGIVVSDDDVDQRGEGFDGKSTIQ